MPRYSSAGEGIYEGVYAMLLCRVACGQMLRMLRPDPQMVEHAIGKVASAVLGDREAGHGSCILGHLIASSCSVYITKRLFVGPGISAMARPLLAPIENL